MVSPLCASCNGTKRCAACDGVGSFPPLEDHAERRRCEACSSSGRCRDCSADSRDSPIESKVSLLIAAEARIDTALSQLILADRGVVDPWQAKAGVANELREARIAIRKLRQRIDPGRESEG